MTGLVRRAMLLTVGALCIAAVAVAGVPSSSTSSQPSGINLVGHSAGTIDAAGTATYTIRDAANNPVPNSNVIINFSACTDLRISNSQIAPGLVVNCAAKTVSGMTNASGVISFRIAGGGGGAGPTVTVPGCATVTADAVPLLTRTASAFDLNGTGGVGAADLSLWAADFFSPGFEGRSDYNKDGAIGAADLSLWAAVFFGAGSTSSSTTYCP